MSILRKVERTSILCTNGEKSISPTKDSHQNKCTNKFYKLCTNFLYVPWKHHKLSCRHPGVTIVKKYKTKFSSTQPLWRSTVAHSSVPLQKKKSVCSGEAHKPTCHLLLNHSFTPKRKRDPNDICRGTCRTNPRWSCIYPFWPLGVHTLVQVHAYRIVLLHNPIKDAFHGPWNNQNLACQMKFVSSLIHIINVLVSPVPILSEP